MIKFMLDAGHGGHDTGAPGPTGLNESDVNLHVTKSVGTLLERIGIKVSYTRTDDTYPSISDRWKKANKEGVQWFVSIHCNSNGPSASGIETLIENRDSPAYGMARVVQVQLINVTGDKDRGVKSRPDLGVLAGTKCPALLIEIGFISHPETEAKLKTNEYKELIAEAIADGIANYLKKENHKLGDSHGSEKSET